jgi:hypothetical protein
MMNPGRLHGMACVVGSVLVAAALVTLVGCGGGSPAPVGGSVSEARYEDPDFAPTEDLDGDVPTATVGGYVFSSASHRFTHPYLEAQPNSHGWVMRGWGGELGSAQFIDFSYGGLVRGIKTLRVRSAGTNPQGGYEDELMWFAQDDHGNLHLLKQKVLAGHGGAAPATLIGAAAGDPAWFLLPRNVSVGSTWHYESGGDLLRQFRVLTRTATSRGKTNLLRVRIIEDEDGDDVFDPSWAGPDDREDQYWERKRGLYNIVYQIPPSGAGTCRF